MFKKNLKFLAVPIFVILLLGVFLLGRKIIFVKKNINVVKTTDNVEKIAKKNCPDGYVLVPGNEAYGLSDFCVMKYDAKCSNTNPKCVNPEGVYKNNQPGCACEGNFKVVSTPNGAPITFISEDNGKKNNAKEYCKNINAHLITNNEWMVIAKNVEQISANWCSKNGTGCGNAPGSTGKILANGHNDSVPYKALEASTDDKPCFGTTSDGSNICGGPSSQKRTLTLSNGEVVWDMAGNVWQWIDMIIARKDEPQSKTNGVYDYRWQWSEFSGGSGRSVLFTNGALSDKDFRPSNPNWNSDNGVGMVYHFDKQGDMDETLYTNIRAGNFRHGENSGIFTIHLSPQPSKENIDDVGFRCITDPI